MSLPLLLIDDDCDIQRFVKGTLEMSGFVVDGAVTAKEAVSMLRDKDYAVVLIDVNLPDDDGFNLCEKIHEDYPGLELVMMTAAERVEDRLHGLDSGAHDYLVKPISMDELGWRVKDAYERFNKQVTLVA